MGWIPNWLRRADVRLRPRTGAQVDLQPLSERSGRWLKANLFRFPGAVWSRKRGCVELSEGEVIALHLVVERITEAGLKVRLSGRLRGWDGASPVWTLLVRKRLRIGPLLMRTATNDGCVRTVGLAARAVSGLHWQPELRRPRSAHQLRINRVGLA